MEKPSSEVSDWDWEVVIPGPESSPSSRSSNVGVGGGGGEIRSDYFSATPANDADVTTGVGGSDEGEDGDDSDNPSWVDPSDISVVGGNARRKSYSSSSSSSSPCSGSADRNLLDLIIQPHADCCGVLGFSENSPKPLEIVDNNSGDGVSGSCLEEEEEEQTRVVWWKVPLEVVRYCVMRVTPVWSLSMAAAALIGFLVLRRRYLHKIKRKSLGIQLNLSADDKKVSQFMSRAARLNEAFSVVKRVPIIRPALPAPGMTPWPVMSFR